MSWKDWLASFTPVMTAPEVGIDKIAPWKMGLVDGFKRLHRPDDRKGLAETFFSVVGRWVNNGSFEWGQALARPIGEPGIIVLFEVAVEDELFYLVTAQEAPGWEGFFVGASLQTSPSKLQGHGVKPDKPQRMDLAKQLTPRLQGRAIVDPRRIDRGLNDTWVIRVERDQLGGLAPTERLVSKAELVEMFADGVTEVHLRDVASLLI